MDTPKQMKSLPSYLTLNECLSLLESVDGAHRERDYCILTLFLNCGLRISELTGLDVNDIQDDALRVLGKGSKVRVVYLNGACKDALPSTWRCGDLSAARTGTHCSSPARTSASAGPRSTPW